MKLALLTEHFTADADGAEAVAVALSARGHELLVCAEHGSTVDSIRLELGPLALAPAQIINWRPELVIDWGLHAPAHIHHLRAGTHAEQLRLSLQRQPQLLYWLKRFDAAVFPKNRRIRRRENLLLTASNTHFLAVSQLVAAQIQRTAAVPDQRIEILHSGVDPERFTPARLQQQWRRKIRRKLDLADDDVVFLFADDNLELNNFALLARLFANTALHSGSSSAPARLVVLGNCQPPLTAPWLRYAAATTQPEKYYAAADAFVLPTWYDPCANGVLEAMAAGLPVISSDRNGSAELIQPDVNGYVLPVAGNGVDALWQEKITALLQSPSLRARLGTAARATAEQNSQTAYLDKFEAYLHRVHRAIHTRQPTAARSISCGNTNKVSTASVHTATTTCGSRRLLFVTEHFRMAQAGAENDLVILCQALAKRGHEVHVVSQTHDQFAGIVHHGGLATIDQTIAVIEPDAVIDWGFYCKADIHRIGGGVHEAFQRYSIKAHRPILQPFKCLEAKLSQRHRAQKAKERLILANTDATFLPISKFVARQLLDAGVDESAVTVVYNGIDINRFTACTDHEGRLAVRRKWGVSANDMVFLFIAHNLKLKNLALLRRVFDQLSRTRPELKLVVIGKRRPKFTAPYLRYGGVIEDIEQVYMAADGLLHPSFYDAFANVVLEAMSCALPVVVSDCTGASELIDHGSNGIVLPVAGAAGIKDQWLRAISEIIENPAQTRAMGAKARATAIRHEYTNYVAQIEAIITKTARVKSPSPATTEKLNRT